MTRFLPLAAVALTLAACGDEQTEAPEDDGRSATGQVLEGTISDEMLPYDRVRSQPPLEGGAEAAEEDADEAGDESA